jgi:hypothetical protein
MKTAEARAALERRQLRFPVGDVEKWASRYAYNVDDDGLIDAVAPAVRERGHFTKDEFLAVYEWKTTRTVHHVRKYTDAEIADVTGLAFRQTDEKLRICLLRALDGVDWPVASVLLHVGSSPEYPVIDFRALWSLKSGTPPAVSFEFWWAYVECCRGIAAEAGVTVRTLDQALWAYSEAKQPPGNR